MAKIDEKFYKANKKFNTAFKALAEYSGTDGESKVQQVYDLMFESLFNTKTLRVLKCDCYFDNGQVVGLCEYKYDINMASKLELSKVIAQVVFYYKRIIECSKYATPNFIFIGDRNESLFFPSKNLTGFLDVEGVDYSVAPSSAGEQMELVKAIMNDNELHGSYMIVNPSECEFSYIRNKAEAIAKGGVYRIPVNERTINRAFDNFMKCVSDVDLDSNELVSTFLDAIRTPEKVSYANGMIAVPGHMPVKVDHRMGGFLAYFDKPKTDSESIELTRLYDTLVKDVDRRKKGFFITPRVWVNLAHQYLGKVLGDNWEMNPNYVVWDNSAGTKSLTRDYRFANLYLSTLEPGEFKATEDLSPEAKETFIFDWLNDPLNKIPSSLYNELKELRRHPEKKLVFLVNPPYGQSNGQFNGNKTMKDSTKSMIQSEMIDNGLGCKGSDLFIQFNYRMAKLIEEFKLKDGQLVIGTFSNPTWMNGIGSVKFLNWYVERMNYQNGFMFNASEFQGCSDSWGIAFSTFINHNGVNESKFFKHDLYENNEGEVKNIGEKTFVSPIGKMTMDKWIDEPITKKSIKTLSIGSDGIQVYSSKAKTRSSIVDGAFGSIVSFGNMAQNGFAAIRSGAMWSGNDHSTTNENFEHASIAYCCRNLIPIEWTNCKDNYFAPTPEIESSTEFKSWARDCVIYSCFSYQTSIEGEVDGEHYDFKNAYMVFKKSEVMKIRNTKLMINEIDEIPYVIKSGYLDNMSIESSNVIEKYRNLLVALEPFRNEFMKNHKQLQLHRWDCGWTQYRGNKKVGFFAKEYAPNEYKEFIDSYKKLGEKIQHGIYKFEFLTK